MLDDFDFIHAVAFISSGVYLDPEDSSFVLYQVGLADQSVSVIPRELGVKWNEVIPKLVFYRSRIMQKIFWILEPSFRSRCGDNR